MRTPYIVFLLLVVVRYCDRRFRLGLGGGYECIE